MFVCQNFRNGMTKECVSQGSHTATMWNPVYKTKALVATEELMELVVNDK